VTEAGNPVGGLLIKTLLESLFDKKESEFAPHFGTWLDKLLAMKIFLTPDLTQGIEQYLKIVYALESDIPLLSKWFTKYFLFPLMDRKLLDLKHIHFPEVDEDMTDFGVYFKVAAEIFKNQSAK